MRLYKKTSPRTDGLVNFELCNVNNNCCGAQKQYWLVVLPAVPLFLLLTDCCPASTTTMEAAKRKLLTLAFVLDRSVRPNRILLGRWGERCGHRTYNAPSSPFAWSIASEIQCLHPDTLLFVFICCPLHGLSNCPTTTNFLEWCIQPLLLLKHVKCDYYDMMFRSEENWFRCRLLQRIWWKGRGRGDCGRSGEA